MANTLNLGNGQWATKDESVLAYNNENNNFKPLPFDFSRGSTATVVNKEGLIETVGTKEPRIDFQDNAKGSLLLEPTSTNLITQSEAFDNSYWTKSGSSVVGGFASPSADSPLGAFKLVENSDTVEHFLRRSIAIPTGQYTWSVFAKASERKYIVLRTNGDGGAYKNACFDVESGVVVYDGLHNNQAKIEAFPNGWFRISGLSKETSGTTRNYQIHVSNSEITDNGAISYNGDGTSGIYIFGAQLEQKSYGTSYIKTQGGVVTRLADTANNAGDASTFNSSEGVLMAEISALADESVSKRITISDGGSANRLLILINNSQLLVNVNNPSSQSLMTYEIPNIDEFIKVAFKYKENDFALWVNGIEVDNDGVGSVFSPNTLNVLKFSSGDNNNPFYGNIKQVQYFDTALTDQELAALTQV